MGARSKKMKRHTIVVETVKSHVIVIVENDDETAARLIAHDRVWGKRNKSVALAETSIPIVIDLTTSEAR